MSIVTLIACFIGGLVLFFGLAILLQIVKIKITGKYFEQYVKGGFVTRSLPDWPEARGWSAAKDGIVTSTLPEEQDNAKKI